MKTVKVDCPAKVNLFLEVLGKRPDGFHNLHTVMAPISLADTLHLERSRRDRLDVEPEGAAPVGPNNTVLKALGALRKIRKVPAVRIRLIKRCPAEAGLGGGSSDAAGLIHAADRLFDLGLTIGEQEQALALVGSDTAFFAGGRPALCTGRGERVFPLAKFPKLHLVLYWPRMSNPTGRIFSRVRSSLTAPRPCVIDFLNLVASKKADRVAAALFNRLETAAFSWRPELGEVFRRFARLPFLGARMSGSGSCLYGVCESAADRAAMARRVGRAFPGAVYQVETLEWRSPKSASS